MKKYTIKISSLILNSGLMIFILGILYLNRRGIFNIFVATLVIALSCAEVIKNRHNIYLLIINLLILYCNYSICLPNYFVHIETSFSEFALDTVATTGINTLCLFMGILFVTSPKSTQKNNKNIEPLASNGRYNPIFELALCVLLLIIWRYGYTRPDVVGGRGTPSAIYEYSVILMIIGFYYCGNKLVWKIILLIITFLFAIQNFIYGGRITGIQIILCAVLCLLVDKINLKIILLGMIFIFPFMSLIGIKRGNSSFSILALIDALNSLRNTKGALDTAYSAYYTSLTFLKAMVYTPFQKRIYMFGCFVLSMFFGGLIPDSNLADYTRKNFLHYWGGVLPFFAYFYIGILGVILLAIYINYIKSKIIVNYTTKNGFYKCFSIYITATTFRWYLYSPTQLFRGVMLLWIAYKIADLFFKFIKKYAY